MEEDSSLFYVLVGILAVSSTILTGVVFAITDAESLLGLILTLLIVYINHISIS